MVTDFSGVIELKINWLPVKDAAGAVIIPWEESVTKVLAETGDNKIKNAKRKINNKGILLFLERCWDLNEFKCFLELRFNFFLLHQTITVVAS